MNVTINEEDQSIQYMHEEQQVELSQGLPDKVLNCVINLRPIVLNCILEICNQAISNATCPNNSASCVAIRSGYLIVRYGRVGLYPTPDNANHMEHSVRRYMEEFKDGEEDAFESDARCARLSYNDDCGVKKDVQDMVQEYVHSEL